MRVQVVSTLYIVRDSAGVTTARHRRGDVFDLAEKDAKTGIDSGLLRAADASGVLPPPNGGAVETRATQPDGTPLDDVPLVGPDASPVDGEQPKAPRTHAEADEQLAALNVTAPPKATVAEKAAIVEQIRAAQTSAGTTEPVSTEDLSELSDADLIQRGVDAGHTENEMVELSHDELVLFVAEAVNRRSADPAQQQAAAADTE